MSRLVGLALCAMCRSVGVLVGQGVKLPPVVAPPIPNARSVEKQTHARKALARYSSWSRATLRASLGSL